ncbi:MAG: hypothetical protein MK213_08470 [Planctomycetes bacterium]|nr:hypothetical protein [Planctomycetota bacterium]
MAKRPTPDAGFFPGLICSVGVLFVWAWTAMEHAPSDAAPTSPESTHTVPAPFPPMEAANTSPTRVIEADEKDGAWSRDERWNRAGDMGDRAIEAWQAAVKEHEEEGGLNLLAYAKDTRVAIERALELLDELALEYAEDGFAQLQIDRRKKRFSRSLKSVSDPGK